MEENVIEKKPKKTVKIVATTILVIFLIFIFIQIESEISTLKQDVWDLKNKVYELTISSLDTAPTVSLTSETVHKIDDKFSIFVDEVETHLSGINIKGKIINTSSVTYENTKFDITVAEQTKELHIIKQIKPGYGREFEFYIPNVPVEKSEYAKIKYAGSMVIWHKH